jgi:galactofuranosylgalactofuranosylrhamnosyl-N-acetylglucosaminyl-diphospho-decaprenol beta-1,5/1,6-galactofuranosyltransferase
LAPIAVGANVRPTAAVPHQDAPWWFLANHDSVLVSAADGAGAAWYQRDPELFRRQLARSIALHSRLFREWPDLARSYRSAAADVTSSMRWAQTFDPPE